jgi:thioredoxin reductase (NADPH)
MQQHVYEAAIVGAGPIGLELAVAMKKAGVDYVHFDAKQIGYTISWYAPQTKFFSSNERIAIAGVPLHTPEQTKATREQYLTYLRTVIELFDLQIRTYEPVTNIERDGGVFTLTTQTAGGPRTTRAKRVVLATGGTDTPRRLDVEGEDLPHVSHYFDDPHKYFRKNLLVVGGRNSAVEAMLRSHHAGANVALSYRREQIVEKSIKYWLMPEIRSLTTTGKVRAYYNTVVTRITSTHVTLRYHDGSVIDVPADFVLALTGYLQDNRLLQLAGVSLHEKEHRPVYDEATMQTDVPGVYVAGTCVGGTQEHFAVFIENCHDHVTKIMQSAFHADAGLTPVAADIVNLPES